MSLKKQAFTNTIWVFVQKISTQLISFLTTMVLARLLMPEDFGLIGMIYVFITVGNVLLDAGFTQSLIRTKNPDQEDYSTIFFFNLIGSLVVYLIIFILAPFIADFYHHPILVPLIRIYSISFVISAFTAVQNARLIKAMEFKKQLLINIPSTIVSGIVGIVMAYYGFGVWSLVWSGLVKAFLASVQLWIYSKWTPSLVFSRKKLKYHFSFGYKLTINEILNALFVNIYPFIIGRFFSVAQVGYYTQSETLRQIPVSNIFGTMNSVAFPLMASVQDNNEKLKSIYLKNIQITTFLITPILLFLAVLADPVIRVIYTDKWLPAVPFLQILCVIGIISPIKNFSLNILKVKGNGGLILRLENLNRILTVIVVLISIKSGIYMLLWSKVVCEVISLIANLYFTSELINISMLKLMMEFVLIIFLALIASSIVYFVHSYLAIFELKYIYSIALSVFCGMLIYLLLNYFLNKKVTNELILLLKK